MECIGTLIALFIISAVLDALGEASKTRGASSTTTTGTAPTRTEPRQLAGDRPTQPGSATPVATTVAWSGTDWRTIESDCQRLPFPSAWSFDRSIRDEDSPYGEDESIWTLDLHGLNKALARKATQLFLKDLRHSRNTCCRIISGRGNNSNGSAVLPTVVEQELTHQRAQGLVAGYSDEDGHFDVTLPDRPSTNRETLASQGRRWPCGHLRGVGESLCWDCHARRL